MSVYVLYVYSKYSQNGMSYCNGTDGIEISTLLPLRRRIGCAIARNIRTGSQNLLNAFQYVKFIFCATNPILALDAFPCVSANMPWYIIFRIKE